MKQIVIALSFVVLTGHLIAQTQPTLRFAQMTDLHLFDSGYSCYGPDVFTERSESLIAIHWAVEQINRENRLRHLDFVVITGDLGLVNLTLPSGYAPPHDRPSRNACNNQTQTGDNFGPVDPITVAKAAEALACLLRDLQVSSIYLIPGNNDVKYNSALRIEDPEDRELYKAFVERLSTAMPGRIRDLTGEATPLSNALPDEVNGYRLIGMDTASFKPSDDEQASACPSLAPGNGSLVRCANILRKPAADSDPSSWPECQDPNPTSQLSEDREQELERVRALSEKNSQSFLVFTHIPDLQDPFPARQVNRQGHCRFISSWLLNSAAKKAWSTVLSNKHFVAIFAGHFHSTEEPRYGGPFAAANKVQASIYVAPPIALKNQWGVSRPQRGILIVELQNGHIDRAYREMYVGFDPTHPAQTLTFRDIWLRVRSTIAPANLNWFAIPFGVGLLIVFVDLALENNDARKHRRA